MAYPTPVVTVRPRYEPFMMTRTRLPATAMKIPAPRGTGSRRLTRCTPEGPPARPADESAAGPGPPGPEGAGPEMVPRSVAAGSVMALPPSRGLRAEPEDLGPEDDDGEEAGVEQDVVVAGAHVAAEHGLGHADHQAGRHGPARAPERREPRGDDPDQAERGPAHIRVAGDRRLDDAEERGQHRGHEEDPPPELRAVDADDPRAEHALAASAGRPPGHRETQVGPQDEPAHDGEADHEDAGPLHVEVEDMQRRPRPDGRRAVHVRAEHGPGHPFEDEGQAEGVEEH